MNLPKIDYERPIESTQPGIKVGYGGPQVYRDGKKIGDEFCHLVLVGAEARASYCDEFGRVRGEKMLRVIIRNIVEAEPPPPLEPHVPGLSDVAGALQVLAEEMHEHSEALRDNTKEQIETRAMLIKLREQVVADGKASREGFAIALKALSDAGVAMKDEIASGILLALEQFGQSRASEPRTEPEPEEELAAPPPKVAVPLQIQARPTAVLRSLKDLPPPQTRCQVTNEAHLIDERMRDTVDRLSRIQGVTKIVMGSCNRAASRGQHMRGKFVIVNDLHTGNGFRAYVYGRDGSVGAPEAYVYCSQDARPKIAAEFAADLIDRTGKRSGT